MSEEPVSILFIVGLGRSGSTLIGTMLHNVHGFACLGETLLIWLRGLIQNQPCACTQPFWDCPSWTSIFERAFGGMREADGHDLNHVLQDELRTRHLLATWRGSCSPLTSPGLHRLADGVTRLYRAAREETGARVIVDTSKSPIYGRFLMQIPELDVRVLHLVRDPRAVANSFRREKIHPITGKQVERIPLPHSAALWTAWTLASAGMRRRGGRVGDYLRVRYEDFVRKPQEVFRKIVEFAGQEFTGSPFIGSNRVELGHNHILTGNFIRYQRGPVEIKPDWRWTSEMSAVHKTLVTGLTWPLLPFYGYPLLPRSA